MTGKNRGNTSLPDYDWVKAAVAKLIPEQYRDLGMSVEVKEPKLETIPESEREIPGQVWRSEVGYRVYLCLGEDRELVGGHALRAELQDWRDSERGTGRLPQMVGEAASALARRHKAGP